MNYLNTLDYQLFSFLNSWAGIFKITDWIVVFIGVYLVYVLVVALGLYWIFSKDKTVALKSAFGAVIAFIATRLVIGELIQILVNRDRPFIIHAAVQLIEKGAVPSFPSGHTMGIVALGAGIYVVNRSLGLWVMLLGVVVGMARVVGGVHYPLDVLVGAGIGLVGGIVARWVLSRMYSSSTGSS